MPESFLKSIWSTKWRSYGVRSPRASAIENSATSCPCERINSINSNRYTSVPLNGKLYLLQNKILIRNTLALRCNSLQKQIHKELKIFAAVEIMLNMHACRMPD